MSLRGKAKRSFKFAPPMPAPVEQTSAPKGKDKKIPNKGSAFAGKLYPFAGMMRHTDAAYAIKNEGRKGHR